MGTNHLLEGFLDLLFPPACHVCGVPLKNNCKVLICEDCAAGMRFVEAPICSICGMEIYAKNQADHICGDCLSKKPPFISARSLFRYGDEVRTLISKLKYQKDLSAIKAITQLLGGCDLSSFDNCDFIIPVPLHKKRLQQRGFNQALLLAKACFGKRDERIVSSGLQRVINTVPQVSLNGRARRNSLRNVFRYTSKIDISGSTICLIDDVYTTGTTVSQCSRALLEKGASSVSVLTFARVSVPHRGRR